MAHRLAVLAYERHALAHLDGAKRWLVDPDGDVLLSCPGQKITDPALGWILEAAVWKRDAANVMTSTSITRDHGAPQPGFRRESFQKSGGQLGL